MSAVHPSGVLCVVTPPLCTLHSQCLPDPNNYHEFCRLLARLKSNYQLGELVKVENYPEVIRLIANFTVTSLQVCGHLSVVLATHEGKAQLNAKVKPGLSVAWY